MSVVDPRWTVGGIYGILMIIGFWSFAYRDNPLFRIAEHAFIGVAAGHSAATALYYVQDSTITPLATDYLLFIPLVFGLLIFARLPLFSAKIGWVARWPSAVVVGVGTALSMLGYFGADIIKQLTGTLSIGPALATMDPGVAFGNIVLIVALVTVITYYIYSFQHRALTTSSKIGRYLMMAAFGTAYGGAVSTRMSWLFNALAFILAGIR